MNKLLTIAAVAGLSLSVAACQSTGDFDALTSISKECRTAYNCNNNEMVPVATADTYKPFTRKVEQVFTSSSAK